MTILSLEEFMNKHGLENKSMKESELKRVYNYKIYPRDSIITTNQGFVNLDNGEKGGTHWTCFLIKNGKSYYFDSFGWEPDEFLLKQLPKPIISHTFKIQHIDSMLCGSYCLYFFYLMERLNFYDVILKLYFHENQN